MSSMSIVFVTGFHELASTERETARHRHNATALAHRWKKRSSKCRRQRRRLLVARVDFYFCYRVVGGRQNGFEQPNTRRRTNDQRRSATDLQATGDTSKDFYALSLRSSSFVGDLQIGHSQPALRLFSFTYVCAIVVPHGGARTATKRPT